MRRNGSAPGVVPVESALATFSEITRKRAVCAVIPLAAILAID
mgnify:CR=1 FL=1